MSEAAVGRAILNERAQRVFFNRIVAAFDCPTFRVHRDGNSQYLGVVGVLTKILFNSTRMAEPAVQGWDSHAAFNVTTSRYEPKVAGYYELGTCISYTAATASFLLSIHKNGSTPVAQMAAVGAGGLSTLVYLNGSTDFVEFYTMNNSGIAQSISGDAGRTAAWGYRIPG